MRELEIRVLRGVAVYSGPNVISAEGSSFRTEVVKSQSDHDSEGHRGLGSRISFHDRDHEIVNKSGFPALLGLHTIESNLASSTIESLCRIK